MFDDVLKHRSGRVIALARAVLAVIFLLAIWVDPSQPAQAATATYAMLFIYLFIAAAITKLTWNDWWADARLAALAHVLDITVFTMLVLATDGYTSPFFVFCVFLILSAAIRWGWRETAITAVTVSILYFGAGVAAGDSAGPPFDLQRFIIRSGNLVILSGILIWFGINQGFSAPAGPREEFFGDLSPDEPLEMVVERAADLTRAHKAAMLWRGAESSEWIALQLSDDKIVTTGFGLDAPQIPERPFLFDLAKDRAFSRGPYRRTRFLNARKLLGPDIASRLGIVEGIALPIRSVPGEGLLLLGGIEQLCTDFIEFGDSLATAISSHLQRHALLAAIKESAGARARLSLARDLHDGIVQFLAGATFRIEAIKRSISSGERPARELQELKELLLQEQQELRSAIGALRSDRISLPNLAADLKTLCERLSRQWDVKCDFVSEVPDMTAPMRLHLDTHQLVREAVANAVRHGGARAITVQLTAENGDLRLDIGNDGTGNARLKEGSPWSLRERVDEANGTLMLASRESGTNVSITLPLKPEGRP